jgi:hypothetical protein
MSNNPLRKTVVISLLGHLTIFSIFTLSFGSSIPKADFADVSFWGAVLGGSQVSAPVRPLYKTTLSPSPFIIKKPQTKVLDKSSLTKIPLSGYYFPAQAGSRPILSDWREKPHSESPLKTEKRNYLKALFSLPEFPEKKEPMILFHPLLPRSFSLYFKDRQVAHVELMFNIEPAGLRNSIAVKRGISSGNLEVDLLCMRYIGRYLFIEQARFTPNKWQTVKIDLSEARTLSTSEVKKRKNYLPTSEVERVR